MMRAAGRSWGALVLSLFMVAPLVGSQGPGEGDGGDAWSLGLEEAVALGRERGAHLWLSEAEAQAARLDTGWAGRWWKQEPELELMLGRRRAEERSSGWELAWSWEVETPGRRRASLAESRWTQVRTEAELAEARLAGMLRAGTTFLEALAAQERWGWVRRDREAVEHLAALTERRFELGEATALDWNRSRTAAAGARSRELTREAALRRALGELAARLGLPARGHLELEGSLEELAGAPGDAVVESVEDLSQRPDLVVLAARLREAESQALLARAQGRPGLAALGAVEREEGADVVRLGLGLSLPVAGRSRLREETAAARARAWRRLHSAALEEARWQVRAAEEAWQLSRRAAENLRQAALPAVADNEGLASRSFAAGEIELGELLQVRREGLEIRLELVERHLAAAQAYLELRAAKGGLP